MDATLVDLAPILSPVVEVAGLVIAGLAVPLARRAVAMFEQRTHIQLTAAQQQTVYNAATTGAGVLAAMLSRGELQLHDVHIDNAQVRSVAQTALNAVPEASAAFNLTVPDIAHMIVGRVGAMIASDPTTPTVAVAAAPKVAP